jgi:hypothetical protein
MPVVDVDGEIQELRREARTWEQEIGTPGSGMKKKDVEALRRKIAKIEKAVAVTMAALDEAKAFARGIKYRI